MTIDRITVDRVLSWGPCDPYTKDGAARLRRLIPPDGLPPLAVCDLADVPVEDRLWCLLREEVIPARELRLLACNWADGALQLKRAAGQEPDPRSWAAVEVGRRHAAGLATDDELAAAWAAALAAARAAAWAAAPAVAGAAWAAAWAAAESAARAAAGAAAWAAAWAAARAAQLADVRAEIVRLGEEVTP